MRLIPYSMIFSQLCNRLGRILGDTSNYFPMLGQLSNRSGRVIRDTSNYAMIFVQLSNRSGRAIRESVEKWPLNQISSIEVGIVFIFPLENFDPIPERVPNEKTIGIADFHRFFESHPLLSKVSSGMLNITDM